MASTPLIAGGLALHPRDRLAGLRLGDSTIAKAVVVPSGCSNGITEVRGIPR